MNEDAQQPANDINCIPIYMANTAFPLMACPECDQERETLPREVPGERLAPAKATSNWLLRIFKRATKHR
jgi:hypothetical protein